MMKKFKDNIFLTIYFLALIAFTVVIILRLVHLQILENTNTMDRLQKLKFTKRTVIANRGSIISADNQKLAFDVDKYSITIDPFNIRQDNRKIISDEETFDKVVEIIANAIGKDSKEVEDIIIEKKNQKSRGFTLKDVLIDTDTMEKLIKDVREVTRNNIFSFTKSPIRYFSNELDFKTIIGYFSKDGRAMYGIESKYDDYLKGKNGLVRSFVPAADVDSLKKGTTPYKLNEEVLEAVKRGNDLHLTIDTIMQISLDDILKEAFEETEAVSTMGILMETDTGKIIAMSSYPKPKDAFEVKNLNIFDIFEPGSIFKPITVAAALNENLVNKNTIIHSEGSIAIKNVKKSIRDHDRSTVGDLTLAEMIAKSGNVAMVKVQQMMERDVFYDYIVQFGIGSKTGIDTNYEANYKFAKKNKFSEIMAANVAFGQGVALTQIQMINALNASINGGKLLRPYLVDYITDEKGNIVKQNEPYVMHTPITEKTSKDIRELLEGVVNYGTGRQVAIPGYKIGGKTGTAQKATNGRYERGKYYSSFFTFFPTDKPKYSLLITVNEPKGVYYGAAVALPPAKKVIEKLIKYKGIKPDYIPLEKEKPNNTEVVVIKKKIIISKNKIDEIKNDFEKNIMPDLIGLSLKEFIKLNPYSKYTNIIYSGSGNIFSQNIKAGETINDDTEIILEFR